MGTNYYAYFDVCPCCKRSEDIWHIGKSSCGWCFTLHVDKYAGINDLEDVRKLIEKENCVIKNEYNEVLSPEKMIEIITQRKGVPFKPTQWYKDEEEFHRENNSQPGPNNLARHCISDRCIGHGDGTWDLVVGEFS